jgi:uncharacterized protein YggE
VHSNAGTENAQTIRPTAAPPARQRKEISMTRLTTILGTGVLAVLLAAGGLVAFFVPAIRPSGPTLVGAQAAPTGGPPSITVTAEGSASAQPDQATIVVGVQTVKPTAAEALAEANRLTEALLAKLGEYGIDRANIQTSGISLFPVQQEPAQPGGPPTITGYTATNQLTVLVSDLSKVGQVIDGVVAAGANQVSGVQFGLRDDSALRAQAMQQAVQGARPQANAIATGLGMTTGDVLSIREEPVLGPPMPAAEAAQGRGSAVPIAPGQLVARVQVQVTFALTPAP